MLLSYSDMALGCIGIFCLVWGDFYLTIRQKKTTLMLILNYS